ncbi:MAG: DNA mismatch repair protein MutS, partial [Chloroflexi bacterium]|nr:DNA mismatch repair protein MutS [Chloroflexota bacterium]
MAEPREQAQPRGITPLRRQYLQVKQQHPDCIVLFRLGDFYETFDDDAAVAARELDITLTSREMGKGQRVPMAGIPYHALDGYLARLIRKGYKVALCEQLTDSAESKGLVDRGVVRVVTPGTVVEPALLETKVNNYLASLVVRGDEAGVAYVDITTSEFSTTQLPLLRLPLELERLGPAELLAPRGQPAPPSNGWAVTELATDAFDSELARERLLEHFGVLTLDGFGCEGLPLATQAAGAVLSYLQETQKMALGLVTSLRTYSTERYVALDPQTRRNLELFQGGRFGGGHSLLSTLDFTRTPMGGRLLRQWLGQPLRDIEALRQRQDAVQWLYESLILRDRAGKTLAKVSDLERLLNRIRAGVASPRELVALRRSLEAVSEVQGLWAEGRGCPVWLREGVRPCPEVVALVRSAVADDPSVPLGEGGVIREGFSAELDELRFASRDAKGFLAGLEQRERQRTGISSLKVGYNRVFGYYLEVSKANLSRVPSDYIRRQTLVNGERFITPELKEYESRVLNAQERMAELEEALFRQVCRQVADDAPRILATAQALARIDVSLSLAEVASRYGYVRPDLNDGLTMDIKAGRHPVVERTLPAGTFVPNDLRLSNDDGALIILTGPNMAGKSTYLRQAALLVLMAQIGSFVPAETATIGLVDRIFTRVGLQDDLVIGLSTFMVEMVETAQILNNATSRSLVILDEIGRGTSTYDGLAIARAVAEHLHSHPRLGCKTLFATHYHELTELANYLPHARNFNVAVMEEAGKVVFLHRIVPGGADKSYGVHVAQLAGLPRSAVQRAQQLLQELEAGQGQGHKQALQKKRNSVVEKGAQLPLLPDAREAVVKDLADLDLLSMTPLE